MRSTEHDRGRRAMLLQVARDPPGLFYLRRIGNDANDVRVVYLQLLAERLSLYSRIIDPTLIASCQRHRAEIGQVKVRSCPGINRETKLRVNE